MGAMVSAAWEVGASGLVAFAPGRAADENVPGAAGAPRGVDSFARVGWSASGGEAVSAEGGTFKLAKSVDAETERDETPGVSAECDALGLSDDVVNPPFLFTRSVAKSANTWNSLAATALPAARSLVARSSACAAKFANAKRVSGVVGDAFAMTSSHVSLALSDFGSARCSAAICCSSLSRSGPILRSGFAGEVRVCPTDPSAITHGAPMKGNTMKVAMSLRRWRSRRHRT
jgi:hypothetical protein